MLVFDTQKKNHVQAHTLNRPSAFYRTKCKEENNDCFHFIFLCIITLSGISFGHGILKYL